MIKLVQLSLFSLVALAMLSPLSAQNDFLTNDLTFDTGAVFDEVSQLVIEHFYDPEFNQNEWLGRGRVFRERAVAAESHDEFAGVLNEMLAGLATSHTYYYSRLDPRRYQLLGVFHKLYDADDESLFKYDGIGIDTRVIDGRTYITAVYNGFPAADIGLQFGDQILLAGKSGPFHPILSFAGESSVPITVLRDDQDLDFVVGVESIDGRTMFEHALRDSTRVIQRDDQRIGYVHAWSYAGPKYQEQIRAALLWGDLSDCDSFILDLRDGWGGADLNYLNLFRDPIARIESATRAGEPQNYTGVWGKPVVLLTNGGSTSGKELFTYGFRKLGLGTVVGETTAGSVVGGRAFLLGNGDVLYLAVTNVHVDGQRLEGKGVQPDIVVPRPVEESDGTDPQLEAAINVLTGRQ